MKLFPFPENAIHPKQSGFLNDKKRYQNHTGSSWDKLELLNDSFTSVKTGHLLIHSVKRLSNVNNENIFTIGDDTTHGIISSFEIIDTSMYAKCSRGKFNLNYIEKVKQRTPLFTTGGDNVLIFDRDRFYSVTDDFDIVFTDAVGGIHLTPQIISRSFSTEDAAKQYILEYKPVLSLADLLDVWECGADEDFIKQNKNYYKSSQLFKNFENLVKQKINQ